jgi:lysylphosphatidylglycerol synthetase-like protein (DUF2156 family)
MWLKIKVWTKIIVVSALVLYALLFIYNNSGKQVDFWWWFGKPTSASVFTLSFVAFLSGVIGAILVRTTWKTYRQIRELQSRSRTQKIERDLADMKSKAAMLKTRQTPSGAPSAPGFPIDPDVPSV